MNSKTITLITPIYPPDIGGPATYSHYLFKHLKSVKQVISFSRNKQITSISKKIPLLRQLFLLFALLRSKSDIFYAQDPLVTGLATVLAAKLKQKTSLVKVVGDIAWERYQDKGGQLSLENYLKNHRPVNYWLTKFSLNLADHIIVPSRYLKSILKTYYRLTGNKIAVIPNFVVGSAPQKISKKNQLIFVGRPKPWKNLNLLIKAFKKLNLANWRLVVVGALSGKNSKTVKFLGRRPHQETFALIKQSKILVLPSSYEGFPHVLLEAGLAGCCVVASDIPGNKEIISHRRNGLLFASQDIVNLAKQLKFAVTHPLERRQLAANLQQDVKKFSLKNHLKQLTALLKDI
jgi:glycosyltransferase involved in cell wall biosynthesis